MKKLGVLSVVFLAFFAFASCGEDEEIDYSESSLTFSLASGANTTFGNNEYSYASLSGTTLSLKSSNETGNETLNLTITSFNTESPVQSYSSCAVTGFAFSSGFASGSTVTVTISAFPEVGEHVTGTFTGNVSHGLPTPTQKSLNGSFNLVRIK